MANIDPKCGAVAVITYFYMFYVLVLQAPGFMINLGQLFPSMQSFFPYSMDYNEILFDGLFTRIFIDVLLAGFFVIPHSICARVQVKKELAPKLEQYFPNGDMYRTMYVLMSSVQLHVLEIFWQPLSNTSLDITFWDTTLFPYPLLLVYFCGYLWLVSSTFALDHCELFGLKQATGVDIYKMLNIDGGEGLVVRLHYAIVRHPIMLGFFIMFFAVPTMTFTHLFFSVACTAYCVGAVQLFEEPDLRAQLGDAYSRYENEVPAYCPMKVQDKARELMAKRGASGREIQERLLTVS